MRALGVSSLFAIMSVTLFAQGPCPDAHKPYSGGNGDPLCWSSHYTLVRAESEDSPALYNFDFEVSNRSDGTVTDVYWNVANFRISTIPKGHVSSNEFPGYGQKLPHPSGPLNYGVGKSSYPTTVYGPENGSSQGTKEGSGKLPSLTSSIEIPLEKGDSIRIALRSEALPSGKGHQFTYDLKSSSAENLYVNWQIPLTSEFRSLEMSRNAPIALSADSQVHRAAYSSDTVTWKEAPVQVFDSNHHWLATGIATVYCSVKGEPEPLLDEASPRGNFR
jgi:hypothetical protein